MRSDRRLSAVHSLALTGALAVSVFAGGANAADLGYGGFKDYAPAPIWTGLYAGGHIGGAWGDTEHRDVNELNTVDPHANVSIGTSDLLYGAQIGYNVQKGKFVYGLEADIGQMKLDGSSATVLMQDTGTGNSACNGNPGHNSTHVQQCRLESKYSVSGGLYGDLTARVGYASNKALFYVKGGAAFLNADVNAHYTAEHAWAPDDTDGVAKFNYSKSDTMWGWTIGAGVEYAFSQSLSLKAEYQHFDFGSMDLSYDGAQSRWYGAGSTTLVGKSETDITADAVKLGVNYRVGR